jgi:D-glycero-D-manno-heptose 1,7-bisphosphate phosphatase
VFDACDYFIKLGYEIIIITNQSGIGRGYYTKKQFSKLTEWMIKEFNKNGINILKVYYCPHTPDENCNCRKPNTGMIDNATSDYQINLEKSWLIGDKNSDIKTAKNASIKNSILIKSPYNKISDEKIASITANSLFDTINIIKE